MEIKNINMNHKAFKLESLIRKQKYIFSSFNPETITNSIMIFRNLYSQKIFIQTGHFVYAAWVNMLIIFYFSAGTTKKQEIEALVFVLKNLLNSKSHLDIKFMILF